MKAYGALPLSPPHVLGMGDGLQMVGIATRRDAAEMVEFQAFADRSNELFVGEAMNGGGLIPIAVYANAGIAIRYGR